MADLVDAPITLARIPARAVTLASTLPRLALPAAVVLLLAALARILDPHTGATPIISSDARGYHLAAALILGCVLAVEVVRGGVDAPGLPTIAAGWTLIVGSATLLFAASPGLPAILAMLALSTAEVATRETVREDPREASLALAGKGVTVALLWVFLFGLLAFHLRWLYALPIAGLAGGLAYLRFEADDDDNLRERAWPAAVTGLASMQVVMAVSFLDVGAAVGATVVVLALAVVVAVGRFDWGRFAA